MRLAGAAEGQKILGISSARWYQIVHEPGFPAPEDTLDCGPIWRYDILADYARVRLIPSQPRKPKSRDRKPVPALRSDLSLP